jgi:hypothetical protein
MYIHNFIKERVFKELFNEMSHIVSGIYVFYARKRWRVWENINRIIIFSANNDLMQFFGKCRDGKIRVFKVAIENGNFVASILKINYI